MHRRGFARGLRGAAAGSLTTTLALAFHVLGGGSAPGAAAVAGSYLGAIWLSVLIGRRRRSLPFLAAATLASQVLLHAIFSAATATGGVTGGTGHAGHGGLQLLLGHGGSAMWWAHAAAGAITLLALHHGERVLHRLAELAALVLRAVLRAIRLVPAERSAPRPGSTAEQVRRPRRERRAPVLVLRGPPASLVI